MIVRGPEPEVVLTVPPKVKADPVRLMPAAPYVVTALNVAEPVDWVMAMA